MQKDETRSQNKSTNGHKSELQESSWACRKGKKQTHYGKDANFKQDAETTTFDGEMRRVR